MYKLHQVGIPTRRLNTYEENVEEEQQGRLAGHRHHSDGRDHRGPGRRIVRDGHGLWRGRGRTGSDREPYQQR